MWGFYFGRIIQFKCVGSVITDSKNIRMELVSRGVEQGMLVFIPFIS